MGYFILSGVDYTVVIGESYAFYNIGQWIRRYFCVK